MRRGVAVGTRSRAGLAAGEGLRWRPPVRRRGGRGRRAVLRRCAVLRALGHNKGLFGRLRADAWTTVRRLCDDCATMRVAAVPARCSCATFPCATCPMALARPHLVHCAVSINTVFLLDPVR